MEEHQDAYEFPPLKPGDEYVVSAMGSLGLLALGDVGLKAWREKREEVKMARAQQNQGEATNGDEHGDK